MSETTVRSCVEQATDMAWQQWAQRHPSLAQVIDRQTLTERTVERLRESESYRQAVDAYCTARNETDLLSRLVELAGPILAGLLA